VATSSNEKVAFLCNRPSMFKTSAGWVKDDSTDCLKNPEDILDYCRKVFNATSSCRSQRSIMVTCLTAVHQICSYRKNHRCNKRLQTFLKIKNSKRILTFVILLTFFFYFQLVKSLKLLFLTLAKLATAFYERL